MEMRIEKEREIKDFCGLLIIDRRKMMKKNLGERHLINKTNRKYIIFKKQKKK